MKLKEAIILLSELNWFSQVGLGVGYSNELVLTDSALALGNYSSNRWEVFKLMVRNRNYRDVKRADDARFKLWNKTAMDVFSEVKAVSGRAREAFEYRLGPPRVGFDTDIWSVLFEIQYADLCPQGFYRNQFLPILLSGRLPCGWAGEMIDEYWAGASDAPIPAGQIMIY